MGCKQEYLWASLQNGLSWWQNARISWGVVVLTQLTHLWPRGWSEGLPVSTGKSVE